MHLRILQQTFCFENYNIFISNWNISDMILFEVLGEPFLMKF